MVHRSALPLVVFALFLGGCTLLNPHVAVPQAQDTPSGPLAGGLDVAIRDANALSDAYYAAVGQQSTLRNGAALALLPLSAAALGVGVTSAGSGTQQALAGLGLGGATLYAGAQYLGDRGRQLVWLKGSEALGCAVRSMRPEMVTPEQLARIGQQIDQLASDLASAEQALDPAVPAQAAALDRARSVLTAARQWRDDIALSGEILEIRIRAIRDRVSEQILRTEPDLNAILAAAGNLRTVASGFAPGAVPAASRALGFHGETRPEVWMQKLAQDEAPLAGALEAAAAIQRVLGGKDDCLPADAAAAPVLLAPGGVTLARGQSADVPVQSQAIPRVALSGPGAADLSASVLADGGVFVVRVTASPGAAPGPRTLVLMDQAGRQVAQAAVTVTGGGALGRGALSGGGQVGSPRRSPAPPQRVPDPFDPPPHPSAATCAVPADDLRGAGFTSCEEFTQALRMVGGDPAITSPTEPRFKVLVIRKEQDCGVPAQDQTWFWPALKSRLRADGTCLPAGGLSGSPAPPGPPLSPFEPPSTTARPHP